MSLERIAACMVLIATTLLAAPMAGAAEPPLCAPETWGQTACIGGVRCECRNMPAAAMRGDPGGLRWDCGINRPRCLGGADGQVPADLTPNTPLPDGLTIEGDTTINSTNTNTNRNAATSN